MQVSLADKLSAKEAWDSIAAARIDVDRVRRATLQRLRKKWENLSFCPGEQIEDFALCLATLRQQMILHGERNLDEERAVEKLLRATPKKYAQLKIAIKTLLDFQKLTIEVLRRLKTVDDEPAHEPVSVATSSCSWRSSGWRARSRRTRVVRAALLLPVARRVDVRVAGGSRRGKAPREVIARAAGKEER